MTLSDHLPRLGHRNWVAVVDAAFPEMVAPGITTLVGGDLESTLAALGKQPHVRFDAFVDLELNAVTDADIPGVEAYRRSIERLLDGATTTHLTHERIIEMLHKAAGTFRVLIVKTNSLMPYTSVFLRLECGYWDEESEKRLRDKMQALDEPVLR